ncbi:unnamed protein product [Acanthoscelides obtectus]|uniref:Uncharacterized protein n=1 Tax=Acanthoscelides obtectus TaxID=200917 RepID=A0A9P0KNJ0_ACAOB|nr:unnamed protein product [Acanthoscelides obtectus]CAK1642718.1 hypothetical protein AOBTE_LOCUS13180 [Acanthoscelides obtectus]
MISLEYRDKLIPCIDHIFIRDPLPNYNYIPAIIHSDITDHFPVILQLRAQNKQHDGHILIEINYTTMPEPKIGLVFMLQTR